MAGSPIQITLYDEDSEPKKTYSRSFVPWRLLKAAIRLAKDLDQADLGEEDVDALADLVVETFGGKFSVEELNDGADIGEMMTVLEAIISRAQGFVPGNPTLPGK
jgi:hypothetical protein